MEWLLSGKLGAAFEIQVMAETRPSIVRQVYATGKQTSPNNCNALLPACRLLRKRSLVD